MRDDPQCRGSAVDHFVSVPDAVLLISGSSLPDNLAPPGQVGRLVLTEPARRAEACYRRLRDHGDRVWADVAETAFRRVIGRVGERLVDRAGGRPDLMSELASLVSGEPVRFPDIAAGSLAVAAGVPTWIVRVPLSPDPAANPWCAMDRRGQNCLLGLVGKSLGQAAVAAEVLVNELATASFEPCERPGRQPRPFAAAYRDHCRWQAEVDRVVAELRRIGAERDRDLTHWTAAVANQLGG